MRVFDASSIIHCWDNYPIQVFPPLYDWIGNKIHEEQITIPRRAFDEVDHKSPECGLWLRSYDIKIHPNSNAVIQEALRIKGLLAISGDNYHPKGVGENDIFIIATAKVYYGVLVSEEGTQANAPTNIYKSKIPRVCNLAGVGVRCEKFIDYLRDENPVFK